MYFPSSLTSEEEEEDEEERKERVSVGCHGTNQDGHAWRVTSSAEALSFLRSRRNQGRETRITGSALAHLALLIPETTQWRLLERTSSTSSTDSRIWSSTPLAMTLLTYLKLSVQPESLRYARSTSAGISSNTYLPSLGCSRFAIIWEVFCAREHRWKRLSTKRKWNRNTATTYSPAHQHPK